MWFHRLKFSLNFSLPTCYISFVLACSEAHTASQCELPAGTRGTRQPFLAFRAEPCPGKEQRDCEPEVEGMRGVEMGTQDAEESDARVAGCRTSPRNMQEEAGLDQCSSAGAASLLQNILMNILNFNGYMSISV